MSSLSLSEADARAISRALVINPYGAVSFDASFFGEHQPVVTEDQWVAANRKLLAKIGDEAYLRLLLDVLKGADAASRHRTELADIVEMNFGSNSSAQRDE